MNGYYYSDGSQTFGPYTLDELREKKLAAETLIWHNSFKDWLHCKDVPEINSDPADDNFTPPIPPKHKLIPGEMTIPRVQAKSAKNRLYQENDEIIISRNSFNALVSWICLHILALVTSYEEIPVFNAAGDPKIQQFWPFVNFIDEYYVRLSRQSLEVSETKLRFNGIFVNYDWTEFCTYTGAVILFVFFYYLYKKAG